MKFIKIWIVLIVVVLYKILEENGSVVLSNISKDVVCFLLNSGGVFEGLKCTQRLWLRVKINVDYVVVVKALGKGTFNNIDVYVLLKTDLKIDCVTEVGANTPLL